MKYRFLEPIQIGVLTLKNRVVLPAMARYLCRDGFITEDYISYFENIARGGVALITTGVMPVDLNWPSTNGMQPALSDDKYIPMMKELVQRVHAAGAKIAFQPWMPGRSKYDPKDIPAKSKEIAIVNRLTKEEIQNIQRKYAEACVRCAEAGADAIEWHNAHNFLGEQFFSPFFNQRTDEYGQQSVENSMRFARECIAGAKQKIGNKVEVLAKVSGTDILPGGIQEFPEILAASCKELEKVGVALITINGGGGLTSLEGMSGDGNRAEGWKVPFAEIAHKAVKIPVAAGGDLKKPEFIEKLLAEDKCDMIALGRTLIADPEWVNKVAKGEEDQIRYCISCLHCLPARPIGECGCTMNPRSRLEARIPAELPKDGARRKVVVIGAGPAGLEAAATLAERNFQVKILEKESFIGGMMAVAAKPVGKQKFETGLAYFKNRIEKLGVELELGVEADVAALKKLDPYAIVVAAGSEESIPPIPGVKKPHVVTVRSYLMENMDIRGKKVALIGASLMGLEAARMLAVTGNDVTVVEMQPDGYSTGLDHSLAFAYAKNAGVKILMSHEVREIADDAVAAQDLVAVKGVRIPCDVVVLSLGAHPKDALYQSLSKEFGRVFNIGDSAKVGKIVQAISVGHAMAVSLK
jgi:2,4-dienoyl-CoA reductase-like NADH-dependent reductase (Old Yellow Enzyme family)/thioredoxin reductase